MAVFRDFNFKLLVVEQLMYRRELLTPQFRIADRMRERGVTDVQGWAFDNDLAFTVLEESRAYFAELEIPDDLLAKVEELCVDGGLEVYQECAPVWDGEDDLFDVRSLDDLDLLPNLRRVEGVEDCAIVSVPDAVELLAARGIVAD
ncbi:hypothetical protein RM572_12530 [Streptomyces sp. DSM 42041]|uniref:DUF6892 domain-containing protein n=1 Tax=Streptomyces hazeniae TaxID=3075538 RepID=A0ABU2NUD5_9ACTN|nr:hypothetical protein [Streptomyces sp. DSM 42041]MDT0379592.1 hypothetical protein [Streptomyces sp. DSM 42041]